MCVRRPSLGSSVAVTLGLLCFGIAARASETPGVTADEALARLLAGNKRFVEGKPTRPHQDTARRAELAKGQSPIAVIMSCSDSRVPPELVFDQGLGDLFVVRLAGEVVDDDGVGSIEYAVEHLGVRFVLVLGHDRCGAVDAALKGSTEGHIKNLVDAIRPAVEKAKGAAGDPVRNAVEANVRLVVEELKTSKPILAAMVAEKGLKIMGARYDVETGVVALVP